MNKIISIVPILLLASCYTQGLKNKIENGDLIFVETNHKNLSGAISRVTKNENSISFDHVVLVEKKENKLVAYHASNENGSEKLDLIDLIKRYKTQKRRWALYRIIDNGCANEAIDNANKMLGKPYNNLYILNENSYYCSDFIERAYRNCNLFKLDKMTFTNPKTGETDDYWIQYYKEKQTDIPEGQLGTNPNAMSKSDKLKLIHTE